MAYRRYNNYSKPTPRNITVKYAAPCACCGVTIKAGEWATYYPANGSSPAKLAHIGGLDGNSLKCATHLRDKADASTNDYAGDGLDSRYEDDCAARCGL